MLKLQIVITMYIVWGLINYLFYFSDPNILYNKTKTKVGPENGTVKYTPLQNGAVDSEGGTDTEPKKSSVLKGDLFMYHDAKTKRQKLLREQEKKRDRLAQVRRS